MDREVEIVIDAPSQLWKALGGQGSIALHLSLLDARVCASAERRLNFWRHVCGCQFGALALLVTLGVRIPAVWGRPLSVGGVALEIGIALSAALAGKALALVGSRVCLAIDIALLTRRLRRVESATVEG
jgi:hypothetical protein